MRPVPRSVARGAATIFGALVVCLLARPEAQSLPVWVDSAIELGQGKTKVEPINIGRAANFIRRIIDDSGLGLVTTPYLRVALAAKQGRERSQPYSRADVKPWMLERVVTFYLPTRASHSPEHVVIRPIGDERLASAIQPLRQREMDQRDSIIQVGKTRAYTALVAEFPMSAFREGHEFYLTYRGETANTKLRSFKVPITKEMLTLGGCPVACR